VRVVNKNNEVNSQVKLQLLSVGIRCPLSGQKHLPSLKELRFIAIVKRDGQFFVKKLNYVYEARKGSFLLCSSFYFKAYAQGCYLQAAFVQRLEGRS
jgi:hypothetical protein